MDHLVRQFGSYEVVKSLPSTMTRYQIIRIDLLESCNDLPNVLVGQWRYDVETADDRMYLMDAGSGLCLPRPGGSGGGRAWIGGRCEAAGRHYGGADRHSSSDRQHVAMGCGPSRHTLGPPSGQSTGTAMDAFQRGSRPPKPTSGCDRWDVPGKTCERVVQTGGRCFICQRRRASSRRARSPCVAPACRSVGRTCRGRRVLAVWAGRTTRWPARSPSSLSSLASSSSLSWSLVISAWLCSSSGSRTRGRESAEGSVSKDRCTICATALRASIGNVPAILRRVSALAPCSPVRSVGYGLLRTGVDPIAGFRPTRWHT
jgi:hypothetical protein